MAYADWDWDDITTSGTPTFVGLNAGGGAIANASFSSPLTTEGNFAREFTVSSVAASPQGHRQGLIKTTAAGGAFSTVPATKAVSLRMWIRSGGGPVGGVYDIGLHSKATTGTTAYWGSSGYKLRFSNDSRTNAGSSIGATPLLRLGAYGSGGLPIASFPEIACSGSYSLNTWYKIRLDTTPVSATQDLVEAYTGVGDTGSEVWTLVGSFYITSAVSTYQPWSDVTRRFGHFQAFTSGASSVSFPYYQDRFQAFVTSL